MKALYLIAFLLLLFSVLMIFNVSPMRVTSSLLSAIPKRRLSLKEQIKQSKKPKKPRGIHKIVIEAQGILNATGKSGTFPFFCCLSLCFMAVGIIFGAFLSNIFLAVALAVGLSTLPFLYIILASFGYKKRLNGELETSLSVITAEYIRSEDIVEAVSANIGYMNPPVKGVFKRFLTQVDSINPDVPGALENLKSSINNDVFGEWIDAMIICQKDRTLKSTLMPIVRKLSDIRVVSGRLNYNLYTPLKEFLIFSGVLIFLPLLIRSLNSDWYSILMYSIQGKITLALDALVFFLNLARVIRLTRPVEYKR